MKRMLFPENRLYTKTVGGGGGELDLWHGLSSLFPCHNDFSPVSNYPTLTVHNGTLNKVVSSKQEGLGLGECGLLRS